jgi:thiol-disulfide isomerase/thioredoxin
MAENTEEERLDNPTNTLMNRYLLIILFLFASTSYAQTSWDPKTEPAKLRLAKFTASIDSLVCNNESLKGNTVYINFWFASCLPCIAEFDALNIMYDKYNIKYPVFYMPKDDIKKLSLGKGYPTSMIVDPDGNITYLRLGGDSNRKEAKEIVLKEIYPAILKSL